MKTENLKSGWNALTYRTQNGVDLLYQLYIPENLNMSGRYAVILYMHSAGVRCSDNSHIYTAEAKFLRNFETGAYKNDAIIIAPCCPESEKWVPAASWDSLTYDFLSTEPTRYMTAVYGLFEALTGALPADKSRIYTYGMSMGAFAVWDLLTRHPGVFAAAVTAAGAGDPAAAASMGKTAIWIFHGAQDTAVPIESAYRMRAALAAAGRTDIRFTEFPSLGHGIWVATADTAGLFDWLFSQSLS